MLQITAQSPSSAMMDTFKANGQRLKLFLELNPQDFEEVDALNFLKIE
jgi:hypothetical protein